MIERGEARQTSTWEIGSALGFGVGGRRTRAGCRSWARSWTSSRSAPAAGASPGSTPAGSCGSGRGAPAPIPGRPATGAAAPSPRSPTPTSCLGRIGAAAIAGGRLPLDPAAAAAAIERLAGQLGRGPARGRDRDPRRGRLGDGPGDPADDRSPRTRPGGVRPDRVRRRGSAPRLPPGDRARLPVGHRAARRRACCRRSACSPACRGSITGPPSGAASTRSIRPMARIEPRAARARRPWPGCRPRSRNGDLRRDRGADVRYVGQSWDIRVPIPAGRGRRRHGRPAAVGLRRAPRAGVRLRVARRPGRDGPPRDERLGAGWRGWRGDGRARRADRPGSDPASGDRTAEPVGHRPAYVDGADGLTDVPVYDAAALQPGDRLAGPALVDGADSTTYVASGFACRVGPHRVLHLVAG